MIYLDNAATTRVDNGVFEKMKPYFCDVYGNPGSLHNAGMSAATGVRIARDQAAEFLNALPEEIIFTSGGSEANSLALLGVADYLDGFDMKHIVASATEHHSVLSAIERLKERGFTCTFVYPDESGIVRADDVSNAITPSTGIVCVMYVNNETGAINEVKKIGALCETEGIFFMTDCVQAAGAEKIDVKEIRCDFASISSHKIHGPKGVGALYISDNAKYMKPLIQGGSAQEFGLRGGTENVPGIVGFGAACEAASKGVSFVGSYVAALKIVFYNELKDRFLELGIHDSFRVNGELSASMYSGKVISLTFKDVDAETLLIMLNLRGVCASAGSACNSLENVPSHVLKAAGLSDDDARSTIRISFSRMNTYEEVVEAAGIIAECVRDLRDGVAA